MSAPEILAVLLAGVAAGAINAIVGSGSLITFPVLLAVGFPAVTANVSNSIGLAFGNLSAAWGYRAELRGQRQRMLLLGCCSAAGAITGAALLLLLPARVFDAVVPLLILLACGLMITRPAPDLATRLLTPGRMFVLGGAVFLCAIYGGYFGAAQGVILLAVLRLLLPDSLQHLNGLKNFLVAIANGIAGLTFILFAHVAWDAAALVATGSIIGAALGAKYGRRIPDRILRWLVVAVGVTVAGILIAG